jgi:mannosyltransferase
VSEAVRPVRWRGPAHRPNPFSGGPRAPRLSSPARALPPRPDEPDLPAARRHGPRRQPAPPLRGRLGDDPRAGAGPAARPQGRRARPRRWTPPEGSRQRIWHARRAGDLLLGLALRYLLFQPWRFVYTSPTPRRHGRTWRAIVNRADAIVAVTERAAAFLDRHDLVLPHGVDTDVFVPPPDKLGAWRESGLPGHYGIGVFGRIRPNKGTHLFVEAMCRLLPRHPEFTAVIAGLCLPADRAYHAELERRIAAAGLKERVVFLGDLSGPDIKLWYRRVALCVSPSLSEGFGLTPLEAMASGAAAVTSRAGAYEQMIEPGVNGALADTGSVEQLVAALEPLLADPAELLAMGKRARGRVLERFSIRGEVAGLEAVYGRLLGRP